MTQLIGERCTIQCEIADRKMEVLWDTGSQVSLISAEKLKEIDEDVKVHALSSLLETKVTLEGVSGNSIPYIGYVNLKLKLDREKEILAPFLVTKDEIAYPIIGSNVIKVMMKDIPIEKQIHIWNNLFKEEVNKDKAIALSQAIVNDETDRNHCTEVQIMNEFVLKPGEVKNIKCRMVQPLFMEKKVPVIVEGIKNGPVTVEKSIATLKEGANVNVRIILTNNSDEAHTCRKGQVVASIEMVRSIIPVDVELKIKISLFAKKGSKHR